VLVGRVGWLRRHPKEAAVIMQAHKDLTQWIIDHPQEAQQHVVAELTELTQAPFDPELVRSAWQRLTLTTDIDMPGLQQFVTDAQDCGLLDRVPALDGMIYKPEQP
jgi:NitT/TauT family transport system substrate-binding protein